MAMCMLGEEMKETDVTFFNRKTIQEKEKDLCDIPCKIDVTDGVSLLTQYTEWSSRVLYLGQDQLTRAKLKIDDLKVLRQSMMRIQAQWQVQPPYPPKSIHPEMNTCTPKLQVTKGH